MPKNSVFICSSSAALPVAAAVQANLSSDKYYLEPWNRGEFDLTRHLLDVIKEVAKKYDFAIIILTADDSQGNTQKAMISGNVIFEMGLFLGVMGLNRTFFIIENSLQDKLPAYIDRITYAKFNKPDESEKMAAVLGPACFEVQNALDKRLTKGMSGNPLVDRLVNETLRLVCQAIATPFTAEEAKLRTFVFTKDENRLVCTHLWAPHDVSENVGTSFEINPETKKQVAVVIAAERRKPIGITIKTLPTEIDGVHGDIDKDLCYILAVPIFGPKGKVIGTVDFDASNWRGENILRRQTSETILTDLGKYLYQIFSLNNMISVD